MTLRPMAGGAGLEGVDEREGGVEARAEQEDQRPGRRCPRAGPSLSTGVARHPYHHHVYGCAYDAGRGGAGRDASAAFVHVPQLEKPCPRQSSPLSSASRRSAWLLGRCRVSAVAQDRVGGLRSAGQCRDSVRWTSPWTSSGPPSAASASERPRLGDGGAIITPDCA
jgi:hypothetical protein